MCVGLPAVTTFETDAESSRPSTLLGSTHLRSQPASTLETSVSIQWLAFVHIEFTQHTNRPSLLVSRIQVTILFQQSPRFWQAGLPDWQ
jgi:hypothetical protein